MFAVITRSAVPIALRALHKLRVSPLAVDLYIWLSYRMSYSRKPTLIPSRSPQAQFGAKYSQPRDLRRKVLRNLDSTLRVYPPPPHVQAQPNSQVQGRLRTGECTSFSTPVLVSAHAGYSPPLLASSTIAVPEQGLRVAAYSHVPMVRPLLLPTGDRT